ncbi:HAD-IB family hydrolase [Asticcacaulis sp. AND118]|uniref:HAD-IB family hydrolase n=1 Tax=Asticcacaulis sp. AND118 TaxID=2840468 RepID=UPI001CFFF2D6|nr:HAD-IB family hydrolase [Asticcacaulis sp. AND118]UDF02489.1 HAD-IB family hydrolase [Asticcacaulis sp. AND118]
MTAPPRPIHAFDFDGTLTYKDSFTAFLAWECGHLRLGAAFVRHPYMLMDYLRTRDRGALKSHLLFNLLGPVTRDHLQTRFGAFAEATGDRLFRPDAMQTWREVGQDALRVIVTASPEMLVGQFGEKLGAERTLGTRLGFDADDRLTPHLDGFNCRGEEKMRRLRQVYGDALDLEAAYGDTSGDLEMLKAARQGHYRRFVQKP